MKKVLVIGEHSYIGTAFREYMEKYAPAVEVEMISARDEKWKTADFASFDSVLHVAAIVHRKEQQDMQQMYDEVNVQLPLQLAKKAKESGVKQFIFLSTMAVYGNQLSPIGTNTPTAPLTMYGKSKLEAEKCLQELADGNFQVEIIRPPMVYGKNCPGNYARLAKLANKMPFFPSVKNQRSMIYIENLCECIRQLLDDEGADCRIVCPQNAEYVNTTELVREIRKAHGKETLIIPFPQKIVQIMEKKISVLQKVFGNLCYEKDSDGTYQKIDFETSIQRTEQG